MFYTCFLITTIILQERHIKQNSSSSYRWENIIALWVKVAWTTNTFLGMVPKSAGFRVKRKYSAVPLPSSMIWSQLWLNQMGMLAFHRCRGFNECIIKYVHICVLLKSCSSFSSCFAIPFDNTFIIHTNTISYLNFEEIPESSIMSHTI